MRTSKKFTLVSSLSALAFWLAIGLSPAKAYKITGIIILDETWRREIYLSAIPTFEDMNTASEDFIVNVAAIREDGYFILSGDNLPGGERLYRLHVCKKGDPPATIFIGGKEENHLHFVMDNRSELRFYNEQALFAGRLLKGSSANTALASLHEAVSPWKRPHPVNSKTNREYNQRQLADQLRLFADTCQTAIVALLAIFNLNLSDDYPGNPAFYQNFLRKWEASAGELPYYQALAQQIEFIRYQESPPRSRLAWVALPVLLIALLVFFFFKKSTGETPVDALLESQKLLSIQEQKVFEKLSNGLSNKEISGELNIEVSTVKSHIHSIYSKLGVKSRKEILNANS